MRIPILPFVLVFGFACVGGPGEDLGGQGPGGEDNPVGENSERGEHGCVGAALYIGFGDANLNGDELKKALENSLPEISCEVHARFENVYCMPTSTLDGCGFASEEEAMVAEPAFRKALAEFDASFESYEYSVIENCLCRSY